MLRAIYGQFLENPNQLLFELTDESGKGPNINGLTPRDGRQLVKLGCHFDRKVKDQSRQHWSVYRLDPVDNEGEPTFYLYQGYDPRRPEDRDSFELITQTIANRTLAVMEPHELIEQQVMLVA